MAHEALAGHVAMMVDQGEKLPAPSRLETILRDPHNKGAVPFLVSAPDAASKAVRKLRPALIVRSSQTKGRPSGAPRRVGLNGLMAVASRSTFSGRRS
jgi:hypothetical protein